MQILKNVVRITAEGDFWVYFININCYTLNIYIRTYVTILPLPCGTLLIKDLNLMELNVCFSNKRMSHLSYSGSFLR